MEAARVHVSLPGESEHGLIDRQGIDFVNALGVDLQYADPERFARLPEYRWLMENATRFGFALSFPRGGEAAFAPWHWHYTAPAPTP